MRPDETAIFTDLDGTLFDSQGKVSPENRRAVERYIAAGGRFALSTGRAPHNALRFIGDLPTNAPSVVFNGAATYDFPSERFCMTEHMDNSAVFPVLRRAMEEIPGLDLQLYTETEIFYCTPMERAEPIYLAMHRPCSFRPLDSFENTPVIKSVLLTPPEELDHLEAILGPEDGKTCALIRGAVVLAVKHMHFFELLPAGTNKGTALHSLRDHPALRGRTILAAGDYWNDYELLQEADVAVAPANAPAEIQKICDYVSVSNDGHIIPHIVEDILPVL